MALLEEFKPVVTDYAGKFDLTVAAFNIFAEAVDHPTFCEATKYNIGLLTQFYSSLYPEHEPMITENRQSIPSSAKKFHYIQMNGKKLSSLCEGKTAKVPYVLAKPLFLFPVIMPLLKMICILLRSNTS